MAAHKLHEMPMRWSLLAVLLLAACGQAGDLYLPDQNPEIVKTLMERNWVRVVGHRDVPGHPELLGTTPEFLDYFSLKSIEDLPPLAELKSLSDLNLQLPLPVEAQPAEGQTGNAAADAAQPEDPGAVDSGEVALVNAGDEPEAAPPP